MPKDGKTLSDRKCFGCGCRQWYVGYFNSKGNHKFDPEDVETIALIDCSYPAVNALIDICANCGLAITDYGER